MATCESRITAGTVESPSPGDWHGGFGERSEETGRWQHQNRAPGRLNQVAWASPARRRAADKITSIPLAVSGWPRRGPLSTTKTRPVAAPGGRSASR
jgi:CubicO group peptidase (beta-lactamase class C family)